MEFVVSKANLQNQLLLAQGIVERKTTLPILSHILLRATAEGIDLVATDLEVGLQGRCDAVVAAPGEVSVQARKLLEIVRSLPEAEIQVRRSGDDLNIQCERSRFRLRGLPAADFPKLPDTAVRQPVVLRAADLRDMIGKVLFAVTVDDPVYSLNGALLQMEGQTLTLVATDGHRLAYISRTLDVKPVKETIRRVVHRKTLSELIRVLGESDEETVSFGESENHLLFHCGRSILVSRFLEKSFPAYDKVLPQSHERVVQADRAAFGDALRRVSLLSSERSRAVRLQIGPGRLEISSNSPELGEASEALTVDYTGEAMTIGFNARYVLDFLEAVQDPRVRLELKDADTQGLLLPDGDHGYDYRYVVMPMQLRGEEAA